MLVMVGQWWGNGGAHLYSLLYCTVNGGVQYSVLRSLEWCGVQLIVVCSAVCHYGVVWSAVWCGVYCIVVWCAVQCVVVCSTVWCGLLCCALQRRVV